MRAASIYAIRREKLRKSVGKGIILLAANRSLGRNYKGNPYPFRQDSNFLYFTGLDQPGLLCLMDCEGDKEWLTGYDPTLEDTIWSGPLKSLSELAELAGIRETLQEEKAVKLCRKTAKSGLVVHYLPPYTAERTRELSDLMAFAPDKVEKGASLELIRAVIAQRSVKADWEVAEIEKALNLATGPLHIMAMERAKKTVYEHEIVAEMYRIAKSNDMEFAYQVICSVRGETLHNESHRNQLQDNQLLLVDAGVESAMHYSSDITRTTPVGGKFTVQQREIYEIVLRAQLEAIASIQPGIRYYDVHLGAALTIAEGLKQLGLMKGDSREAVRQGAHALFFPHGLGHMMGLDVHDMEDLGEDYVGYDHTVTRSTQFGMAYLRMARKLEEGFVLTVEPGIYFIPDLINLWKAEKKHEEFINYPVTEAYTEFGGIRIEDNILVTSAGHRVLGNPIPKQPEEVEQLQFKG